MVKGVEAAGAKLGPRVARLAADAVQHAQVRSGPHKVNLAMQVQERFFRLVGHEIGDTIGPYFRQIAEHELTPPDLKRTFAFLADGLGQWQTFLASNVGGQILGQGLGALITNELEPAIAEILSLNPAMILPASVAASAAARGHVDHGTAAREAAFNGINGSRFDMLRRLAQHGLDGGAVVEAHRRGLLSEGDALAELRDEGFTDTAGRLMLSLGKVLLSPATLADAVVRGIVTEADAARVAAEQGVSSADFAVLVADTGEAPALQTLLEGYRRGLINDATLEHGIRTGRLRNEWIPLAKQLRYVPPSPAEVIAGAVQGHLPLAEAQHKAMEAGLDPREFQWQYETHGEPISVTEALRLWNMGKITQATVEQVIREGRTKNKYVPAVLELRRHLLPERTVVSMHSKGALNAAQTARHLADLGVSAEDIHALLAEGTATKAAAHRALSEATVLELFEDGAIDREHAQTGLAALGYDPHETAEVLALHELRAERKLQTQIVTVVRSRYVARHIDRTEAGGLLDEAGLSATERDRHLGVWDLERGTTTRLPTVAELTHAAKANVITSDEWAGRLVALGYSVDDVPIMAAAHGVTLGG